MKCGWELSQKKGKLDIVKSFLDKKAQRIQLIGFIRNHKRFCKQPHCRSTALLDEIFSHEQRRRNTQLIQSGIETDELQNMMLFLKEIMHTWGEKKDRFDSELYLEFAYISFCKLDFKLKAVYEVMLAKLKNPRLKEQFLLLCLINLIHNQFILERNKKDSYQVSNDADFTFILQFQKESLHFRNLISETTNLYQEFWREMLKSNLELKVLLTLGVNVRNNSAELDVSIDRLSKSNGNTMKEHILYALYLKIVEKDVFSAIKAYNEAQTLGVSRTVRSKFLDAREKNYGAESRVCLIKISGELENLGTIVDLNHEVEQMLGYKKDELMHQNVSEIMPGIIGRQHNSLVLSQLNLNQNMNSFGQIKIVYTQHAKGFFVSTTLVSKYITNQQNKTEFLGFLNLHKRFRLPRPEEDVNSILDTEVFLFFKHF